MKDAEFSHGLEQFAICLHDHLCRANPGLNIIYSPLSIQTSAAMLRMGTTEGSATGKEMDEGLRFGGLDAQEVAESFGVILKSYEQCKVLKMANGLYVMKGLQVDEQFGHILEQKFRSKPMEIDFGSEQAASIVSKWNRSVGRIFNIVNLRSPASFIMKDAEFSHGLEQFAICLHDHLCRANPGLNIIYSPLSIQTSAAMLRMGTTEGSATGKEMDEGLRFGGLDAQEVAESFGVILKSYEQCKVLKMANGLYVMKGLQVDEQFGHILEQKFRSKPMEIDFGSEQAASIVSKWVESQTNNLIKDIIGPRVLTKDSRLCLHCHGNESRKVDVKIPSFTAEFQQELSQVFMSMGMNRIFSGQAELGGMLQSEESLFVSKIVHKAFIEVNEVGTEAAAATV
ncbi:GM11072 [Drosophila sechellia]|uniref:GM11072 n=1 Tax=Drosophila sechellia TaxID=7238 RepID=B4IMD1_DROSE|nr:GM11072 [Drosophila sechellia]